MALFTVYGYLIYIIYNICAKLSPVAWIQLVGGSGPHNGRVEVYYNGQWGTVCDDRWNVLGTQTEVVCRELGFPGDDGYRFSWKLSFGHGKGPIWLDNVHCLGSERRLSDCSHKGWGIVRNCGHWEDAGILCQRKF